MARARSKTLLALTASLCAIAALGAGGVGGPLALSAASASTCLNANLTPSSANVAQVRAAVLCLIDQERERHGEGALTPNAKLTRAAQQHSHDMASEDYFSHVAPDGETPLQRLRASGYIVNPQAGYVVGENIAWGTMWLATPQAIVKAWMESPGHRANILDGAFRETGVGVEPRPPASLAEGQPGALYTQDFGTIVAAGHSSRRAVGDSSRPSQGASMRASSGGRARTGSSKRSGRITSGLREKGERSNTHHGSTRRQSRHRHRVRARHRARHRRAARRARRKRADQRSRRRRRQAGR